MTTNSEENPNQVKKARNLNTAFYDLDWWQMTIAVDWWRRGGSFNEELYRDYLFAKYDAENNNSKS